MASAELKWIISATDHASDVLGKVGKNTDALSKKTKALADAGRMLGAGAIIAFGVASVKAYADAEKSQVKLQEAYRKFPAIADVSIQSMRDLNSAIQAKTGTDDDELAAAEAKLAMYNLTGSQIRDLIPLVNDFAVVQGIGVTEAAGQVGKALMGNTRALKALGIDYKVTGDRAKDMQNIMGLLEQKVGGAGDAFGQTAAGQMQILQASFSDLQEEVGAQLVPALQAFVAVAKPVLGVFGSLPQPIKAVVVGIAGLGAAALIAGPRIMAMRAAMLQAGAAGAVVGKGMGIATRALMVYAVAVSASAAMTKDASLNTDGLAEALQKMAATGEAAGAAAAFFGEQGSLLGANLQWATGIGLSGFDKVTYGLGAVENALGLTATTSNDAKAQIANLDSFLAQLAGTSRGAATAGLEYVRKKASELNIPVEEVNRLLPSTVSALNGINTSGSNASEVLEELTTGMGKGVDQAKLQADTIKNLKSALDDLGGNAIDVDSALAAMYDSFQKGTDEVTKATEETDKNTDAVTNNRRSLDLHTAAGRATQGALAEIASKADSVATAMIAAGASTGEVNDKMGEARRAFIRTAMASGLSRKAARELADQYGLIPRRISTTITNNAASTVRQAVIDYIASLNSIPEERRTQIITEYITEGQKPRHPTMRAGGGYIRGAGTGTSDSIPAMLSNGEYVIRAASVSRAGIDFLHDLNDNGVIDNGMIDNVAITAGSRSVVTGARDRAQAQSAEFWSHTVLQVDGKQLAESLVKYKRSIGNRPLGVS